MTRTATVKIQDKNIRHIGWGEIDSVPLSGMEMAASMDPSLSFVEERPTKKCPTQCIGFRRAAAALVS